MVNKENITKKLTVCGLEQIIVVKSAFLIFFKLEKLNQEIDFL